MDNANDGLLFAYEAERAVLSACLLDPDAIRVLTTEIGVEDFVDGKNRVLWEALIDHYDRRERPDVLSLARWLESRGHGSCVSYMQEVRQELVKLGEASTEGASSWATQLREASGRRMLNSIGEHIQRLARNSGTSVDELHARALEQVVKIRRVERQGFRPISSWVESLMEKAARWFSGETVNRLSTGFPSLDKRIGGGLAPGRLYVVGGRPSMFKTAFSLHVAYNVASWLAVSGESGVVAVSTLEMGAEDLLMQMACRYAKVDSQLLTSGRLKDQEDLAARFMRHATKIGELPLYLDESDEATSAMIHYRAALLHSLQGVRLLVIDFAELIADDEGEGEENRVSWIFRRAKGIAKVLGIPVILISQLSRAAEQGLSKVPSARHLRWSGMSEAIADDVWLTFFPFKYQQIGERIEPPEGMVCDPWRWYLIIGKSRFGSVGWVEFKVEPEYTLLTDEGQVKVSGGDDF
jgi:replicative DNA helicase